MAFSGEATWYAIVAHVLHEFVYAGVQRLEQEAQNLQRAMIDGGPDWGVCPEHQGVFRQIPLRTLIQIGWTDLATTLSSWPRRPVLALRANLDATRDGLRAYTRRLRTAIERNMNRFDDRESVLARDYFLTVRITDDMEGYDEEGHWHPLTDVETMQFVRAMLRTLDDLYMIRGELFLDVAVSDPEHFAG